MYFTFFSRSSPLASTTCVVKLIIVIIIIIKTCKTNDVRNGRPRASVIEDYDETATELALGRADQL